MIKCLFLMKYSIKYMRMRRTTVKTTMLTIIMSNCYWSSLWPLSSSDILEILADGDWWITCWDWMDFLWNKSSRSDRFFRQNFCASRIQISTKLCKCVLNALCTDILIEMCSSWAWKSIKRLVQNVLRLEDGIIEKITERLVDQT